MNFTNNILPRKKIVTFFLRFQHKRLYSLLATMAYTNFKEKNGEKWTNSSRKNNWGWQDMALLNHSNSFEMKE